MKKTIFYVTISLCAILIAGCSSSKVFIKEISSSNTIKEVKTVEYSNYWEAMENLEFNYVNKIKVSGEYEVFSEALKYIVNCNLDSAEIILKNLCQSTKDTLLLRNSKTIYNTLLFTQSKWAELSKLDSDSTGVYKILAQAFSSCGKEQIIFPQKQIIIPSDFNWAGTPVIEVEINGYKRKFLFDTGAGLTVVSSDVAQKCGILPIKSGQMHAATATSKKIDAQPTVISNLKLGELLIKNHPAIIIDEKNLEVKLLGIRFMKIDGIIGWNAIQNFRVIIDYKNELLTLNKPEEFSNTNRNFFWLGFPIIKLYSQDGIEFLFGFDSGAKHTSFNINLIKKININSSKESTEKIWGAGGFENIKIITIPEITLIIDNYKLHFKNRKTSPRNNIVYFKEDGTIGSDIRDESLTIDYKNGVFKINNPE